MAGIHAGIGPTGTPVGTPAAARPYPIGGGMEAATAAGTGEPTGAPDAAGTNWPAVGSVEPDAPAAGHPACCCSSALGAAMTDEGGRVTNGRGTRRRPHTSILEHCGARSSE